MKGKQFLRYLFSAEDSRSPLLVRRLYGAVKAVFWLSAAVGTGILLGLCCA